VQHNPSLKDNHPHDNLFLPAPISGDPSEKQSHPKKHSDIKHCYGLYYNFLGGISSPSEGSLALLWTFDRGRFSLLPFYPGLRGPIII